VKPAAFAYHAPRRLGEALSLLASLGEDARPLAGGQSLVPMMNMRIARPSHLVDLNGIDELAFIREDTDGVEIGALTRHEEIERSALLERRCPILPGVARTIGHYAIRTRGTLGGSLGLADPAAQWPLVAQLLEARIAVESASAARSLAARDYLCGVFTTALQPGELVVGVSFPVLAAREGWGYRAFTRRHGDFAIVAAAATLALAADGTVEHLRLALGGMGGVPLALSPPADAAKGVTPDERWIRDIAALASAATDPPADVQASAEFRRELAQMLVERALADALARAKETR
jgi:carbon-monoxide dehydrogenase medium subunit